MHKTIENTDMKTGINKHIKEMLHAKIKGSKFMFMEH